MICVVFEVWPDPAHREGYLNWAAVPGTPWADSTVGGIMAANADHGRMHFNWAKAGPASA